MASSPGERLVNIGVKLSARQIYTGPLELGRYAYLTEADVEIDDADDFIVHGVRFPHGPPPLKLWGDIDWHALAVRLVHLEAYKLLLGTTPDMGDAQFGARLDQLAGVERRAKKRRRGGLTPAELEKVVEAYMSGGAEQVARALHVSIRQASRYVSHAKAEGLL